MVLPRGELSLNKALSPKLHVARVVHCSPDQALELPSVDRVGSGQHVRPVFVESLLPLYMHVYLCYLHMWGRDSQTG